MADESSLTSVPDAPTAPAYASAQTSRPSVSITDPSLVQMELSIPSKYQRMYPKLSLDAYHLRTDSKPSNVLAFVQNAAKREIADLVTVIIPALQQSSQTSAEDSDNRVDIADIRTWWNTFLRFLFFVAETDDDIVRLTIEPVAKIAKRLGDFKHFNALHRRRKSLGDRYSFTMEVVFRAADNALEGLIAEPSSEGLKKTVAKLEAASRFMLDTMELSRNLVIQAENFCDLELSRLEYSVGNSLHTFARSEISVFACLCARWLEDEKLIKNWLQTYCGIRGRLCGDRWRKCYAEGRGKFIPELAVRFADA